MLVNYIFLAISILISVVAQTFLKNGVSQIGVINITGIESIVPLLITFMVTWQIVVGLVLYIAGTFVWLVLLSRLDLSFLYPIGAIQYILIFIFSYIFLGENITMGRIVGLAFILLGVLIINKYGAEESGYI